MKSHLQEGLGGKDSDELSARLLSLRDGKPLFIEATSEAGGTVRNPLFNPLFNPPLFKPELGARWEFEAGGLRKRNLRALFPLTSGGR